MVTSSELFRPISVSNRNLQKGWTSMYARVTTIQFQQGKFEEGMQLARESVEPAVRQQSGLKSFLALQDSSTGKAMLITLFESEAAAKAGVSSGFVQQQTAKIASTLAGTPITEFYEVAAQE